MKMVLFDKRCCTTLCPLVAAFCFRSCWSFGLGKLPKQHVVPWTLRASWGSQFTAHDELDAAKKFLDDGELALLKNLLADPKSTINSLRRDITEASSHDSSGFERESTRATAGTETATTHDNVLNFTEFVEELMKALSSIWDKVEFITIDTANLYSPKVLEAEWTPQTVTEAILADKHEGEKLVINLKDRTVLFRKATEGSYTKYNIEYQLGLLKGDKKAFEDFCERQCFPIVDTKERGVIPAKREYVEVDGANVFDVLNSPLQSDKTFALVVAGESGSGKSVFSCLESKAHGYTPLYILLRLNQAQAQPKKSSEQETPGQDHKDGKIAVGAVAKAYANKPDSEFDEIHAFLREALISIKEESGRHVDAICNIKAKLNKTRNSWARNVLSAALREFCGRDLNAQSWWEGKWTKSALPEKVAIILDEATDIDLVEGLIETVRTTYVELGPLVKEHVILVLAGTGLDFIRYGDRVGTNPACSRLIRMKGPNLQHIVDDKSNEISPEICQAVASGLFSRVLQSNSRMLFRGILPILQQPFHSVDGAFEDQPEERQRRYAARLKEIASFGPLMDYGVRFYVTQNTVGDLTKKNRDVLLMDCFIYHLSTAIESPTIATTRHETVRNIQETELEVVKQLRNRTPSNQIFDIGLAARSGTSAALKYMACFGFTCPIRPSFGHELEELTALHYQRLMMIQGYNSQRVTLRYAWPPKSSKKDADIDEDAIADLRKRLLEQSQLELANVRLVVAEGEGGRVCTIFSQGTASAQGGDVFALLFDTSTKSGSLVTIQCKHYQAMQGPIRIASWWSFSRDFVSSSSAADSVPTAFPQKNQRQ